VTLGSAVWASRKPRWEKLLYVPKTRALRQALLVLTYVFFALSFGSFYHYLFQINPRNFTITPTNGEVRQVEAILDHQQGLENLRDAEDIIAATVVGLRTEAGRRALSDLADILPDNEIRETLVTSLSLSIVGPPRQLTSQQAADLARLEGIPAEEIRHAEETVAKTTPEFLMPLPYWSRLRKLQRYQMHDMKWLIQKCLEKENPKSATWSLADATEDDNRRLAEYLTNTLRYELGHDDKVDLKAATTPIRIIRLHEETALELGTLRWHRLSDLIYFSFMTISTVGYGDILPNSTCTRITVVIEVMLGIVLLVFFVNEVLRD